ncbi:MAG: ATP-binding cassette domain-containing protein [Thermoplasmata archaeon]
MSIASGPGWADNPGPRALEVRDLHVRYAGREAWAVRSASLAVGSERVVIVGPNGSGKSTLLRAAMGLVPIDRGSVRVLGRDVRSIRGEVGVGTNLAEVYRLMTIPLGGLIRLWAQLKGCGEDRLRHEFDAFGLEEAMGRPLFRLSTGQAKLVGDLLALAGDPRLLLLDEPFDNVDFGRRRRYLERLGRVRGAIVMNTHELDLLPSLPDWSLCFMFEGQLIGRFRTPDVDRLYVSRGLRPSALATFDTTLGPVSVTFDDGEVPIRGASNLSYLLERIG